MFPAQHWNDSSAWSAPEISVFDALKWGFPKMVVPQNGWFIMENPIKIVDVGVPLFLETSKCWCFRTNSHQLVDTQVVDPIDIAQGCPIQVTREGFEGPGWLLLDAHYIMYIFMTTNRRSSNFFCFFLFGV